MESITSLCDTLILHTARYSNDPCPWISGSALRLREDMEEPRSEDLPRTFRANELNSPIKKNEANQRLFRQLSNK